MESTPLPASHDSQEAPPFSHDLLNLFGLRNRSLLIISAIAAFALVWWIGGLAGIPSHRNLGASLLLQPSIGAIILSLIATAIGVILCAVLGIVIAGTVRYDVGLFAAAFGLLALSCRGGTMSDVLRTHGVGPSVFFLFIGESILLYAMLMPVIAMQSVARNIGLLKADVMRDGFEEPDEPLIQKMTATVAMMLAMLVGLSLLAQSEDKAQVLWAVGLSALGGAAIAHTLFPVRPIAWYVVAPLLMGVIGYIAAYVWPAGVDTGVLTSQFAPLARPLPLDYVSAGTIGTLLGYWLSRKWHHARQDTE